LAKKKKKLVLKRFTQVVFAQHMSQSLATRVLFDTRAVCAVKDENGSDEKRK